MTDLNPTDPTTTATGSDSAATTSMTPKLNLAYPTALISSKDETYLQALRESNNVVKLHDSEYHVITKDATSLANGKTLFDYHNSVNTLRKTAEANSREEDAQNLLYRLQEDQGVSMRSAKNMLNEIAVHNELCLALKHSSVRISAQAIEQLGEDTDAIDKVTKDKDEFTRYINEESMWVWETEIKEEIERQE